MIHGQTGIVRPTGSGDWERRRTFAWGLTRPRVRVPWLLHCLKQDKEIFGVLALDVVTAIIKNIDHGIVIQPQYGAGIKREPMLQGDFDTSGRDNGCSLLDCHNG